MKKLLTAIMALSRFTLSYGQKKIEKQITGKRCSPCAYRSTGELKGFELKKGSKCSAINVPSLDLKVWKVDNGYLIVEGFSKEDDGKAKVCKTCRRTGYLTSDSLRLIVNKGTPRLAFLCLDTKLIKELAAPGVKQLQTINKLIKSLS